MRYAIVNLSTNVVVNAVEYATAPSNPPPGFSAGFRAVAHVRVSPGWTWDGSALIEPAPPAPPGPTAAQIRDQTFIDDVDRQELLTRLKTATPAQIKTYITANITDLASARVLLMKILMVLAVVARG